MATVAEPIVEAPPQIVAFAASEFHTWLRHRKECGGDRRDEVWDGVYVVMPLPNNNHQELGWMLCSALHQAIGPPAGARLFPGCNVSDNAADWTKNYRCPDIAVFLAGNPAADRETHWLGGPDFAVEIVSRYDRSREKLDFYAKVGVRELLFVDREPSWSLELYRRDGQEWHSVGTVTAESPESLASEVLAVSFRLIEDQPRPRIEVARHGTDRRYLA
jgi:Uma2 family endonuclease